MLVRPMLVVLVASVLALAGCGVSAESPGSPGGDTDEDGDEQVWHINNQQTRHQDVYFTDEEIAAGLEMMEQTVVIPGGERNGRDATQARCWMVLNTEGMLRQMMWCGPLINGDGLEEWSGYPFAAEGSDGDRVIIHAPMLRDQVGRLSSEDTLLRPDGLEVPASGAPGAPVQTVERPEAKECAVEGTIAYQGTTLDLVEADYLDIETTVQENQLTTADSATTFIVDHVIRFWNDGVDAGHVLYLSSTGPLDGPYEPRALSLNPYLQTREQMETGAGASQSLSASPNDGGDLRSARRGRRAGDRDGLTRDLRRRGDR